MALSAGAGLGISGPQLAFGGRFRIPFGRRPQFVTLGSNLSFGPYGTNARAAGLACLMLCMNLNGESPAYVTWKRAYWHNVELGYDRLAGERGLWRFAVGYGYLLNPNDSVCEEEEPSYFSAGSGCDRTSGQKLLYAVFQVGFAL